MSSSTMDFVKNLAGQLRWLPLSEYEEPPYAGFSPLLLVGWTTYGGPSNGGTGMHSMGVAFLGTDKRWYDVSDKRPWPWEPTHFALVCQDVPMGRDVAHPFEISRHVAVSYQPEPGWRWESIDEFREPGHSVHGMCFSRVPAVAVIGWVSEKHPKIIHKIETGLTSPSGAWCSTGSKPFMPQPTHFVVDGYKPQGEIA